MCSPDLWPAGEVATSYQYTVEMQFSCNRVGGTKAWHSMWACEMLKPFCCSASKCPHKQLAGLWFTYTRDAAHTLTIHFVCRNERLLVILRCAHRVGLDTYFRLGCHHAGLAIPAQEKSERKEGAFTSLELCAHRRKDAMQVGNKHGVSDASKAQQKNTNGIEPDWSESCTPRHQPISC